MSLRSESTWPGSLRITLLVIGAIFLGSMTALSLSIASAVQVYSAPIDESLYSYPSDYRWSLGWHIAYLTTAPLISTVHSLLDFIIYIFARLSPTYAIIGAPVMATGWILQLVFWLQCDFIPDYGQCQQFYLVHDDRVSMSGAIVGVSTNVTAAKIAFGFLLVTLYAVYSTFAAIAVYRKSSARRWRNNTMEKPDPLHQRQKTNESVSAAIFYA